MQKRETFSRGNKKTKGHSVFFFEKSKHLYFNIVLPHILVVNNRYKWLFYHSWLISLFLLDSEEIEGVISLR